MDGPSIAVAKGRPLVRVERGKSSSLRESGRRVAVMVMVISCHLGLLLLLLRPVICDRDTTPIARNTPLVLKLRFIRQPQPTSTHLALPAPPPIRSALRIQRTPSGKPLESRPLQRAAHVAPLPTETHLTSTPTAPDQYTGNEASTSDGGFQDRLLNAQHSHAVHGVPGSDTPSVPGIHLIDPMSQGIGAVMRNAQRLFGVSNRHCIDADAWRHLTPQELIARHISPEDVDKIDEKYGCNRPPGLSF